jgi:O-antigen ligase
MKTSVTCPRTLVDWLLLGFVLWFGSYAYLYIFGLGGPKPLYSYFLLLAVTLFYLLYRSAFAQPLLSSADFGLHAFLGWLAFYLVYVTFEFLRSAQDPVAIQRFITSAEAILLAGAFVLLMVGPRRFRLVVAAMALLALFAAAVDILDFVDPTFSKVPGRAAGLYANPNTAGNFIALAMVGGMSLLPRRLRLIYVLACGAGVFVTFSREAWIIWALAIVSLGWQGYFGNGRRRKPMIVLTILIGVGFSALLFGGQVGSWMAESSLQSYLTPNTAARLGIDASVLSGGAADQRQSLVDDSLREAAKAPWLGHGLGYTREWQYRVPPHNMYLLFFVEGGVIGLAVYVALMFLLWRTGIGIGQVVALQIIVSSFFSHNHLGQPAIVMMMAFVFAHSAMTRGTSLHSARAARLAAA